jgi:hypothetical protein
MATYAYKIKYDAGLIQHLELEKVKNETKDNVLHDLLRVFGSDSSLIPLLNNIFKENDIEQLKTILGYNNEVSIVIESKPKKQVKEVSEEEKAKKAQLTKLKKDDNNKNYIIENNNIIDKTNKTIHYTWITETLTFDKFEEKEEEEEEEEEQPPVIKLKKNDTVYKEKDIKKPEKKKSESATIPDEIKEKIKKLSKKDGIKYVFKNNNLYDPTDLKNEKYEWKGEEFIAVEYED